jgi:uncharacterized cupin superfamily protein
MTAFGVTGPFEFSISLDTGDCAGFKAGERDGHHLQNRGEATAIDT